MNSKTVDILITKRENDKNIIKRYNKYYSTNSELIYDIDLSAYITKETNLYEPYYGDGSLLSMTLSDNVNYETLTINDITKISILEERDNLKVLNKDALNCCLWEETKNNFIITNPPYTSKNKLTKELKEKYKHFLVNGVDDLYLIFINQLITEPVNGGFVIIPSNFIFGKHNKAFYNFINIYGIDTLNIYEKKVFENTTQSVISLLFYNKSVYAKKHSKIYLHKNNNSIINIRTKTFNKILSYDIAQWLPIEKTININISRAYKQPANFIKTHIKLSLLDYNMKAFYVDNPEDDKESDRAFMTICVDKPLTEENQREIINSFNDTLKNIRDKTHSLIFTSYREYDRKRLTFTEAIHIIKYAISKLDMWTVL